MKALSGIPQVQFTLDRFQSSEIQIEIHEQIQNNQFYLIQSIEPPVNEHYMEFSFSSAAFCFQKAAYYNNVT